MATERQEEWRIERIVLAFGDAAPPGNAARIAAALAKAMEVSLAALLVEDERLLRLADLPMACEIGSASASSRPFGREEVERALRGQALRARRQIERVAASFALPWSLEVVRGDLLRAALDRVGPGEPVVLWRSAWFALPAEERRPRDVAGAAAGDSTIVAMCTAGPAGARALRAARNLARITGADLVLLTLDERAAWGAERSEAGVCRIAEVSVRAVTEMLRAKRAGLVVVARDTLNNRLVEACERSACPMCLVA